MNESLHTLRQGPFIWFLLARLMAVIALQMLLLALAWQMYDLTESAWDLGLVGLFQFLPALLLALPAGQAADRWSRTFIFSACLWVQALTAVACAWALYGGWLSREWILGLSVVLGVVRAFQMPAQQALTPSLVAPALLPRAIALSSSAMQVGIIGGPALGGLLYAWDPVLNDAICAFLTFVACLAMWGLRRVRATPAQGESAWSDIWAGLRFVWQRQVLLGAVTLDMLAVLLGGATALLPVYAKDVLMVGPEGLGLLRACPALGALLMSLLLTRWPIRRQIGPALFAAIVVFGLATIAFGLCTQMPAAMLALMVIGAADNVSVVIRSTVMQMETPENMRGRVSAVNSIFIGASNQLGEFESGAVAAVWGAVASVVSGGLGTLCVAAWCWQKFPSLARRRTYEG